MTEAPLPRESGPVIAEPIGAQVIDITDRLRSDMPEQTELEDVQLRERLALDGIGGFREVLTLDGASTGQLLAVVPNLRVMLMTSPHNRKQPHFVRKQNSAAVFCREYLKLNSTAPNAGPSLKEGFDAAFAWLDGSLAPTRARIGRRYLPNARMDHHDFDQILREFMLQEALPEYDPTQAPFEGFFGSVAWRRLQDNVGQNISALSTPYGFLSNNGNSDDIKKAKARAKEVYYLDGVQDSNGDPTGLSFEIPAGGEGRVEKRVVYQEGFGIIKSTLDDGLSPLEKAAWLGILNGKTYVQIAIETGKDVKAVDNAQMRAIRKLTKALEQSGHSAEDYRLTKFN